jgi:uncharacterized protein YjbI with pentapeptide repeats
MAHLQAARLERASLVGANLEGAKLKGANLNGSRSPPRTYSRFLIRLAFVSVPFRYCRIRR